LDDEQQPRVGVLLFDASRSGARADRASTGAWISSNSVVSGAEGRVSELL
jgi:hypothetical protein